MPLSKPLGITDRFNTALSGTPDKLLTLAIILVALGAAYLALTLPPGAKPALLAYLILP